MTECSTGKTCFRSVNHAKQAMKYGRRKSARLRVYLCPECDCWHMMNVDKVRRHTNDRRWYEHAGNH